jgi:hypothetical protein
MGLGCADFVMADPDWRRFDGPDEKDAATSLLIFLAPEVL